MAEYKIIHEMKINSKVLVTLDRKRNMEDMGKSKVIIDNESFNYSLTHGDNSLIIDTEKSLNGKMLRFE